MSSKLAITQGRGICEKVPLEYFWFLSSVTIPLHVHIWELGKGT